MTIRGIASLSVEIPTTHNRLQLLPAGTFRARDGRPKECAHWHIDAAIAALIADQAEARQTPYVIDYEHQTLAAAKNGLPAPAAGWFSKVEWVEGDGLYAVDVEWTDRAAAMIAAKEYRFISPVFSYDQKTGQVEQLLHAGLTNNPALDGMDEVTIAAASQLLIELLNPATPSAVAPLKENPMDIEALLEQLRWLLNMPVGATADEIKAQLQKLIDQLSGGQGTAAASVNLAELLEQNQQQIAALSANQVDLARFVPIEVSNGLREQVAALTAQLAEAQAQSGQQSVEALVQEALSDGRLLPAQEQWARDLGKSNFAALKSYVDNTPPIAALRTTQTVVVKPAVTTQQAPGAHDGNALAICSALGIDPSEYAQAGQAVA